MNNATNTNGGIWGHSAAPQKHIIFSIDGENNYETCEAFEAYLTKLNIGFKLIKGSYKGQTENSWIVNSKDFDAILDAGYLDNQESILVLGGHDARDRRQAHLEYLKDTPEASTGDTINLGWLGSVEQAEALACEAYSYRPDLGQYFIAKENWG